MPTCKIPEPDLSPALGPQIPQGARIIGAACAKMSQAEFRGSIREALIQFIGEDKLDKAVLLKSS